MALVVALPSWMRVAIFLLVGIFGLKGKAADSFAFANNYEYYQRDYLYEYSPSPPCRRRWRNNHKNAVVVPSAGTSTSTSTNTGTRTSTTCCRMVRNIDQVEALIFYGTNSIFYPITAKEHEQKKAPTRMFLPGVEDLIEECKRDETVVLAILGDDDDYDDGATTNNGDGFVVFGTETSPAPNPRDLWEAIHSIEIHPKGFGGSSGFGQKAPDPERSPSPAHCVVLCDTVDRCRAARYAGTRVLCLTENELADGVMNIGVDADADVDATADLDYYWESINMDDIAMPGSFWLNPPHPKDDEGNGVDVLSVIQSYNDEDTEREQRQEPVANDNNEDAGPANDPNTNPEDEDRYLKAILMDIDAL